MKKNKELKTIKEYVWDKNPITYQILGICSSLAVTVQLNVALVMCAALVFVVSFSNLAISLLRKWIPVRIRIIVQLTIVATLVILADEFLKAYLFDISKKLSIFVGLIITNCILLGRAEGYAMQNPPWPSFVDGLANGLGYSSVLVAVAFIRELLGSGSLFGYKVVPDSFYQTGYMDMGIMVLAPGAFLILGLLIWAQRTLSGYREEE